MVYDTFRYIYQQCPTSILISGYDFKCQGLTTSEPDFYVRENNKILLIESKDFYMRGSIKLSYEFTEIEKALTVDGLGNPDRLGKATMQLKKNIIRILRKALSGDSGYELSEITIYPIIIIHDAIYSAPGLNHWFHFIRMDLLEELKIDPQYRDFDFRRIQPVTLVEIDTLLFLEESLHQRNIDLALLLHEFHNLVDFARMNVRTAEDIQRHGYQSNLSFSEFIRTKTRDEGLRLET